MSGFNLFMLTVFVQFFIFSTASVVPTSISQDAVNGGASCGNCVFPFIYNNRIHNFCTNIGAPSASDKWCSTVENYDEAYDDDGPDNFERCTDTCPGMTVESMPQMNVDPRNAVDSCYCGIPNYAENEDGIIGGDPLPAGAYPWQVALLFGSNPALDTQACGGTLVGDKYVITSAQCTLNVVAAKLSVRIGDTSLGTDQEVNGAVTIKVKEIITHPEYDYETYRNDIAILVLKKKVSLTKLPNIKPACLPQQGSTHTGTGHLSGWGTLALNYGGRQSTSWLHGADVNVYKKKDCGSWLSDWMTDDMLCAGPSSCQVDGGGPLMIKDPANNNGMTLIGVWGVNGNGGCDDADSLGVLTKVSENIDWLKKNMPNLNTCPAYTEAVTPTARSSGNRVTAATVHLQKGKLLAVIPEWGPNFRISFDLKVNSFAHAGAGVWANVFRFTATGANCCSPGDRLPALWTNTGNFLHFCNRVGDNGNFAKNTIVREFPTNTWRRVVIEQMFVGYQWRYSVKVEGLNPVVNDVVNTKPGKWNNVHLYLSDNFHPAANAVIRNFHFVTSSSFEHLPIPVASTGLQNRVVDVAVSAVKGKLLAVIPEWGPNFRISFDLKVTSFDHAGPWANVFHFTATGGNCCSPGDRVPALWTNNGNFLHFSNRVGNNGNYAVNTGRRAFPTNTWTKVVIEQKFVGYQWRYSVQVERIGKLVDVVNPKPGKWTDVAVYVGSPHYPAANSVMRNFWYTSSSTYDPLPLHPCY